jgi:hypothetical protein
MTRISRNTLHTLRSILTVIVEILGHMRCKSAFYQVDSDIFAVTLLALNFMHNNPPMRKQKSYPIKRKVEDKGHALPQH